MLCKLHAFSTSCHIFTLFSNELFQSDEIEALSAIYGDDWRMISDREYNIQIQPENDQSHGVNFEVSTHRP